MYDLTKWFTLPSVKDGKLFIGQPYGWETHHLEGLNLQGKKVISYHQVTPTCLWFVKTPNRFPWDGKPYDANFIYDRITELNWTSPRDFKQFNPPLAMCPRYWDGDPTSYQFHSDSPYEVWQNCVKVSSASVGQVLYTIEGPYYIDFSGDVGYVESILLTYYWNNLAHREQLFLTDVIGWAKWTHGLLAPNNRYVIDSVSLHNKIVAGSLAANFPCNITPAP
jgi:hypothetical protein